jgi:hypothetical protein
MVVFNNQQMLQAAMKCKGGLTMEEGMMMTLTELMNVTFSGVGKGDGNNNSDGDGDSDSEGNSDGDSDGDGNGDGNGNGDRSEAETAEWR